MDGYISGGTLNRLTTYSAEETHSFGRRIGELLQPSDLVLLSGTLGAGKTTLTQGIAWGAGATEYAHSPTFVLINQYSGRIPIFHVDLYRFAGSDGIADLTEVEDLAIFEMLDTGACVVEWAERAASLFVGDHLQISVSIGNGPDERLFTLSAHGKRSSDLVRDIERGRREV